MKKEDMPVWVIAWRVEWPTSVQQAATLWDGDKGTTQWLPGSIADTLYCRSDKSDLLETTEKAGTACAAQNSLQESSSSFSQGFSFTRNITNSALWPGVIAFLTPSRLITVT